MTAGRSARTGGPGREGTPRKTVRRVTLALLVAALVGLSAPATSPDAFPIPSDAVRPTAAPPRPGSSSPPPLGERAAMDPPVPSVAIRVRAPAEAAPGKELTYRLIAENCTKASAHHVVVRVTLPPAATFVRATPAPAETGPSLVWKLGTLGPCGKREITLVAVPAAAEEVALCARVQFEHGQCVRTRMGKSGPPPPFSKPGPPPAPKSPPAGPPGKAALQLRISGPSEAALYDIVAYTLEVRNVGGATARDVIVRDALPKGASLSSSKPAEKSQDPTVWELGDLPPGRSAVIEYNVVLKERGELANTATASAADAEPREARHTIRVGQPALKVSMTGPKQRGVGRPAAFHLTVTNPGDRAVTNVQLTDQLVHPKIKEGTIEVLRASDGGRLVKGDAHWNLGTLAPGARRTVRLELRAHAAGEFVNVCTATADRGLTDKAGVETKFTAPGGLAVEIDPDRDPLEVGQVSNVVVVVHNAGPANDANVAATITLPEGLKLIDLPGVKGHEVKGRTVVLPRRPVDAGKDATVVLQVQAEKSGPMKMEVAVTSDGLGAGEKLAADETLTVLPATSTSRKSSW